MVGMKECVDTPHHHRAGQVHGCECVCFRMELWTSRIVIIIIHLLLASERKGTRTHHAIGKGTEGREKERERETQRKMTIKLLYKNETTNPQDAP